MPSKVLAYSIPVVHSETKALCLMRNFIIIFILTILWYDAIMKLLNLKGWSIEAWLVYNEGIMVFDEQMLIEVFHFSPFIILLVLFKAKNVAYLIGGYFIIYKQIL